MWYSGVTDGSGVPTDRCELTFRRGLQDCWNQNLPSHFDAAFEFIDGARKCVILLNARAARDANIGDVAQGRRQGYDSLYRRNFTLGCYCDCLPNDNKAFVSNRSLCLRQGEFYRDSSLEDIRLLTLFPHLFMRRANVPSFPPISILWGNCNNSNELWDWVPPIHDATSAPTFRTYR